MNKDEVVLLLGSVNREGATMALRATKKVYKHKLLDSGVQNWESIDKLFEDFKVTAVVAKLNKGTMYRLIQGRYEAVRDRLFNKISKVPNIFFCHETLLTGRDKEKEEREKLAIRDEVMLSELEPGSDEYYDIFIKLSERELVEEDEGSIFYEYYFSPPPEEVRVASLKILRDFELTIVPYKKNYEISLLASSFIERQEHGLIFRFYVPAEKLWSSEIEKMLQLFRDYLQKVSGINVRQDQHRTSKGIVYEFFGGECGETGGLVEQFNEFTEFMDSCVQNPEVAKHILESKNLNKIEVIDILEKYSKEARRIHVDLKHERERTFLKIRHGMESELAEYARTTEDWQVIDSVINASIPNFGGGRIASAFSGNQFLDDKKGVTINISQQIIDRVEGVVAKTINGDQYLCESASKIMDLIRAYGGKDASVLRSCLYELSDEQVKTSDKIEAKSRLLSFLLKVSDKIGDAAAGLLQSYLESKIGI